MNLSIPNTTTTSFSGAVFVRCPRRGSGHLLLAMSLLVVLAPQAFSQSEAPGVHEEIQSLQAQIDQLKLKYDSESLPQGWIADPPAPPDHLRWGHATERNPAPFPPDSKETTPPSPKESSPPSPKETAPPKPKETPSSAKTYPTVKLTGFFQADAGWFSQDAGNIAAVGDIQDGADIRRARLAATGDVWDNVGYMLEFDFAFPGRPSFMDVWLELREVGDGNLRIGQYRQPFGMDGQTSVKELTFFERSLPFAFLPFRQIGAMYFGHAENEVATWAVSGFRFPTDVFGGNVGDSGGYGLATRVTALLVDCGDDGVVHVGGGHSFGDPANNLVRYAYQPEFFVGETGGAGLVPAGVPSNVPPFVDTGLIPTNNFNLFNAELGVSQGSFHGQSEVFLATLDQISGPRATFSGAYVQAGYILTGEIRPYNRTAGVFGRVVPRDPLGPCGWGAWEIAGRWSYIDLNDANVRGGRLNDVTGGLNWYLNGHTKLQFNYIHAFLNSSPAVNGPIVNNSNADIFAVRAQVDF